MYGKSLLYSKAKAKQYVYIFYSISGPTWPIPSDGKVLSREEISQAWNMLYTTTEDIIHKADDLRACSISLPPIGTGKCGYPSKPSFKQMIAAVYEYPNINNTIKFVRFVSTDQRKIQAFKDELKNAPH